MELFGNNNQLLKLFVEFLGGGQHRSHMTHERWIQIEKDFGSNVYSDILYLVTQKEFSPEEARYHWFQMLDHQTVLNRALGRQVGFQVAMVDYFTNVHPLLGNIVFVDIKVLLQKERAVLLDELTGLYNQRFFDRVLRQEVDHSKRFKLSFSLLIIRVDRFKEFSNAQGRQASEQALSDVARILLQNSRDLDHAIRYGDYEFVMVLPRCGRDQALNRAHNYRQEVKKHSFSGRETVLPPGSLTISVGLAVYPMDARNGLELFKRAEKALQRASETGLDQAAAWV